MAATNPIGCFVVCSLDYLAMGVIKAAAMIGISVPEDLSVIGADDVPISNYITPSLSSVHVDLVGIGKRATSILMDILQGKQIRKKRRCIQNGIY